MPYIDLGMNYKALLGDEEECGDIGFIKEYSDHCFLALVDILGHGREARKVAIYAKNYLENNYTKDIVDVMNGLHECLRGTRGAVAAICNLNISSGELEYVGIGNITVRVSGIGSYRVLPKDGIIGYRIQKPHKQVLKLYNGETLILYSDGIKEHFNSFECESLFKEDAGDMAEDILKSFGKNDDDASCIVLKYSI